MGSNAMTLPLHVVSSYIRGFDIATVPRVLRMMSPRNAPTHPADIAIARSAAQVEAAVVAGFRGAVLIADIGEDVLPGSNRLPQLIVVPKSFDYLSDGDLLGFRGNGGRFRTLYRRGSAHNAFLVTERCNHYCLMCSQPPRDVDDGWLLDEIRACLSLMDPRTRSFAFTGGEPLLEWQRFMALLSDCRDILPNTAVHVLSNGRAFADKRVVAAWADVRHHDLMVGIPIYSAVDHVHDYVVQARGAFNETLLGILKLKDRGQRVEVRVVLHAITAPRIVETCRWLARNLPFVDHIALMGLENTGFAIANDQLLWIDPVDYRDSLSEAVDILASVGLTVSVYNLPLCLLARSVWPFAVQSISDWKNGYVEECEPCVEKGRCSGFFTSGRPRYSRGVNAILSAS
jgi:His-Xaa-Ser system radical SAM maturase HxsC